VGRKLNTLSVFVCFFLGNSQASEFYVPTFRNTLLVPWNRQGVPKCRHIKFRRRVITQKKLYNIQDKARV